MFFHIILSFSRYFIFYYYVILSRSRVCDVFLGNEFRVALETVYLISVYILQLAQLYCRYFINVPLSLSLFLSYFLKGLLCFAGEIYFEDRNTKFPCSLGSTAQRR